MKIHINFVSLKNSDLYLIKIHISFWFGKIFRFVFNENKDLFFTEKFSDLYLMKI